MPNRFADAKTIEELVYQLTGAGSVCWEKPEGAGVFDDVAARAIAEDGLERLVEIMHGIPSHTENPYSMEFTTYVRRPFTVEALEVTVENIHELSEMIGEFFEDESGPYIEVDPTKIPTVTRVTPGYWVTKMNSQVRCYAPRVFNEQFSVMTPSMQHLINKMERRDGD